MTVPEERENDPLVLDLLGFGTPARLEPFSAPAEPAPTLSPSRELVSAPLTRRELRERERSVEVATPIESRRGAPSSKPSSKPRSMPRRTAKNTTRRDAVRVAGAKKKSLGKRLLSFGAMLFAGALAFGMTVPANAFDTSSDDAVLADSLAMEAQTVEVDPTLVSFAERDAWSVTSWAEMLRLRYGNRSFDYTVGTGPIRWPFPYAVPISSGFGDRAAPCRGCSTAHSGIDFNPGYGAAIFAIADGVVVEASGGGSSWGTYAVIQHQIDGQTVFSGYAHMVGGSTPLVVGQEIKVGDFVGLVGATGQSTGAHLHFTISIGERMQYVDPYTYLKTYAS
ncbi:M23 family metallopeptidase [Pseudolysinimonas sp.]|uniref:M23 family metallopeptidase n=1 Tax=Pseudolysinimonas sp. TaxID=2680009 RepID=UPI00286C7595|nr:M23 family metallopeptidase [Pseudolysinimonas sp.]